MLGSGVQLREGGMDRLSACASPRSRASGSVCYSRVALWSFMSLLHQPLQVLKWASKHPKFAAIDKAIGRNGLKWVHARSTGAGRLLGIAAGSCRPLPTVPGPSASGPSCMARRSLPACMACAAPPAGL